MFDRLLSTVHSTFFLPGVKVEGILRQAADVDDVERRIREYEQGLYL